MTEALVAPLGGDMPLTTEHLAHLRQSAISDTILRERNYVSVGSRYAWRQLDRLLPDKQVRVPGIAIPIYRLGVQPPMLWLLRPDTPRVTGLDAKPIKYEWPTGQPLALDVLPRYRAALGDPTIPLWFTEGAKKADALASAFDTAIVPINLNGVWGWRGANKLGGKLTLPDFEEIALNGRKIVLAFDSDVVRKRQVLMALSRLAALLKARGAQSITVLVLPQSGNDKTGVDDFLAQGKTTFDLESHLVPLQAAVAAGRQHLFKHPDTGVDLYLPAGYLCSDLVKQILRLGPRGDSFVVYPDLLAVTALGEDLLSGDETLTVRWAENGHSKELTAPRAELARARGVIERMAAQGAAVHEGNAKEVARFLIEFAYENVDALPRRLHVARLGLIGEGVVLPAGGINFAQAVQYVGRVPVQIGSDADAYKQQLHAILAWEGAWALWLILGLSLAAPAIFRLQPRRYPAVYLAGESGSGKTTLAQWAIGCWGDPTRKPFRIEAGRTTRAGYLQSLKDLGGLPLFVDEAHTSYDPKILETLCYDFANGQAYTHGGIDGKAKGGELIGGCLLLAGEATPEFRHAGSQRRMLWLDGATAPPLGQGTIGLSGTAAHALGQERAQQLERCWCSGAGWLGHAVTELIWQEWATFAADYTALQQDRALAPLQAWRDPLAAAAAALNVAFHVAAIDALPWGAAALFDQWATLLTMGHEQQDVATEAFERLVVMLTQAEECTSEKTPNWITLELRTGMIACRLATESVWRVLIGSEQFEDRIGKTAVQLYGPRWVQRGWVVPKDGKASRSEYTVRGTTARVIMVPFQALQMARD